MIRTRGLTPDAAQESAPKPSDRLDVLDVLRGIALFGMFLVHFSMFSSDGTGLAGVYQGAVGLLFEERFWAVFGMLFGVGFAIQFRGADARGERFVRKYLRRLLALAAFGFIAHAVFGFNVLLGYAIWGVPLLLVRKWSIPVLVAAVVLSAASGSLYRVARATYGVATIGEPAFRAEKAALAAGNRSFNEANREAQDATTYSTVFAARLRHMRWFYVQWFTVLPVNTFTLFLLGVLGLRLGLFERPDRHRRLIAALVLFGAASWAVSRWLLPAPAAQLGTPLVPNLAVAQVASGFGLVRELWLAFSYVGLVLLLVARDPVWLRRLAAFGWTGRMALTNYMIQIAVLDLAFAKYALGLAVTPLVGCWRRSRCSSATPRSAAGGWRGSAMGRWSGSGARSPSDVGSRGAARRPRIGQQWPRADAALPVLTPARRRGHRYPERTRDLLDLQRCSPAGSLASLGMTCFAP